MLVRGSVSLLLVAGCTFQHGQRGDGGFQDIDAPLADARPDVPAGAVCFGTGLYQDCYSDITMVPSGAYSPPATIDTSLPATCTRIVGQSGGPELCVHAAGTITITSQTRVIGARALVLVATDAMTITGTLDASSHGSSDLGAAANTGNCTAASTINGHPDNGNGSSAGAGGGGGGGFGTAGGAGGSGGTSGGGGGGAIALAQIRGGCPGGSGGASSDASATLGGAGGGVLYLVANTTITVSGSVRANGGGGGGAGQKAGGGGGGAGGLVAFDAPTVTITGSVFANGGGGGEGGDSNQTGSAGGESAAWNARAAGGSGGADSGGNGGTGSLGASGGTGGSGQNSGGGGGGGAGKIKMYPTNSAGMISPPAT